MTDADFQALMRRPLRDVITEPGGSTVEDGHMVDHTHDTPLTTPEDAGWGAAQFLFALAAGVTAVLAIVAALMKGYP